MARSPRQKKGMFDRFLNVQVIMMAGYVRKGGLLFNRWYRDLMIGAIGKL
jgi:hypothetical protein